MPQDLGINVRGKSGHRLRRAGFVGRHLGRRLGRRLWGGLALGHFLGSHVGVGEFLTRIISDEASDKVTRREGHTMNNKWSCVILTGFSVEARMYEESKKKVRIFASKVTTARRRSEG